VPPPADYRVWYSDTAAEFLFALSPRDQWRLWLQADELARNPFVRRGYQLNDHEGHELQHHIARAWVLAYWVDHAHRAVMIVSIEAAD
jgi:hypothetical protein